MKKDISLVDLLQAGAHFGHKTARWNPKNKANIFASRSGVHIIDLEKTKAALGKAANFAKQVAQNNGTVLFVNTRKHTAEIVKQAAISCGMPYVNVRWLGGTFTNFKTIQKTMKKLESLQAAKLSGEFETRYTKKERLLLEREISKMDRLFEGMSSVKRVPEAVYVADVLYNQITVKEAVVAKVKVIGVVDTNASSAGVDFPIPANDDAEKAVELIVSVIAENIKEGKKLAVSPALTPQTTSAAPAHSKYTPVTHTAAKAK